MNRSLYVAVPLIALLVVLQTTLMPLLKVAGIMPQLAIVAAISWALQRGPMEGMVWAFLAGMLLDAFSFSPLGITALSLMVAIFVVTRLQQVLPENPLLLPALLTGLTFAAYLALSLVLLRLLGYTFTADNIALLPPAVLLHALLGMPAYWLAGNVERFLYTRQIEV
jgi:rod shape-determining protein MreD